MHVPRSSSNETDSLTIKQLTKAGKNHYNNSIKATSMSDVITSKKWAYNSQEIKQLQRVLKRTPLLIQERPLQYARKAYSQTLKGMFLNQEKHVESLRGVKILTNNKRVKRRKGWGELILWTRFVHKILWYNIRERNIRLSWKY